MPLLIDSGDYTNKSLFVETAKYINDVYPGLSVDAIEMFNSSSEEFTAYMLPGQEHCIINMDSMYDPTRTVPATGESVLATAEMLFNYDIMETPLVVQPVPISEIQDSADSAAAARGSMGTAALLLVVVVMFPFFAI
eukprot:scaffold130237_cov38-Prasinocladus_malaysianus.AAC.1